MRFLTAFLPAILFAMAAHAATAGKPLPESDPEIVTVAPIANSAGVWIGGVDRSRGTRWLALCANRDAGVRAWSDCTFLGIEIEPDFISSNETRVVAYDRQARMQICDLAAGSGWKCRAAERVQLPFYNCPAGVIC